MAPTSQSWDHEYNTLRREDLFRNPPTDRTAYPALQEAVNPHIESFNALFRDDDTPGLIDHAIAEIGTKTFLDGNERAGPAGKNRLTIRYKSVTLQKAQVPPTNKWAKRREIFPAECRERHVSYRGKLTATLEYRINNGEPVEFVREIGQMPIMIKVSNYRLRLALGRFADVLNPVQQMPPTKQLACVARGEERGVGRAWRIFYRQRHRKNHPSAPRQQEKLPPRNCPSEFRKPRPIIYTIRHHNAVCTAR